MATLKPFNRHRSPHLADTDWMVEVPQAEIDSAAFLAGALFAFASQNPPTVGAGLSAARAASVLLARLAGVTLDLGDER